MTGMAMLDGSLPGLPLREVAQVGGGVAVAGAPHAWIAPGTGLDVRVFVGLPADAGFVAIEGDGAHAPLHSDEFDEAGVLDALRRRTGVVSSGDVLSVVGLVGLHRAICTLRGLEAPALSAAQIVDAALAAQDAECSRAVAMFCGLLGDFAAGVALHHGARGGIYLGGDVVPRLGTWFARSSFRRRFESNSRARDLLRAVPTFVVQAPPPWRRGTPTAAVAADILH